MEVSMRRRTVLQFASVQAETENHEKRRNLALRCQLQPVHAAHPSFTNVDHSKKAAQHLVAASLQSRPAWTTGQRASLPDTRRFAKSQLLLRTAMPWAASNCKLADKMNTTVTTISSSSDVPMVQITAKSISFCQALLYPYHICGYSYSQSWQHL